MSTVPALPARGPVRQAARELLSVTAALPLGLIWLIVFTVAISVGASLFIVMVGIPILVVTMMGWRPRTLIARSSAGDVHVSARGR